MNLLFEEVGMRKAVRYIKYRNCLITLAVVALLFMVFVSALPVSAAPVITLVPSSGAVGTTVTISGTVFDSYEGDNIHIFFDTREIDVSPITVPEGGAFTLDFIIPADSSAGQHSIKIKSEVGLTILSMEDVFTVDATVLILDAVEGPSGTAVNISGSGFYINSSVTLYYYNPDAQKISTVAASSTGAFVHSFVIPAGPGGSHKITASNDQGNSAEVQYKVLSQIKLSLDSAGPGDLLNVRGAGFVSSGMVNIFFGLLNVATAGTDALGSFEIEFNIPDVKPLTYDVKSQDNVGNSSIAPFTVTAIAKLSEDTGSVGSQLTLRGGGFKPGATIIVYYDGNPIATTATDNNGDFTVTITIPPSDGGKHVISISDGATTRDLPFSVETQSPPVPTLLLPLDNSLTRTEGSFDWLDVTDVSVPVTYDLEIASDRNFSIVVLHKTGLTDSQYILTDNETLVADFKNAPYFWRVKAIDGAGNVSEWSAPWIFYVSVPSVPALLLPANDSPVEFPIHFSWQAVSSLSSPVTYDLQITKDLDFTSPLLDKKNLVVSERLISKDDNLKLKKGIAYYWRVQAIDAAHNTSGWSAIGSFRFAPRSAFPSWAIYTLISIGAAIAALLAFRFGRKSAFH
jgi:hypothetical protein